MGCVEGSLVQVDDIFCLVVVVVVCARLMEELKKQKDFAQLSKRQKQKALEEAKRKQAEEQTEAEREAARAAKVEAERMNRIAKRTQRCVV